LCNFQLKYETANVGRAAKGVEAVKHQVALPERRISRIHLGISSSGVVTDWRSFYGTTVDAQWLPYGEEKQLEDGDILALSGLEVLRYREIVWHPWDYLRTVEFADEPPIEGWAILIDGRRQAVRVIQSDAEFVTLRDGMIGLSDQPSDDAILVVRRRVLHKEFGAFGQDVEAVRFPNEKEAAENYESIVLDGGRKGCKVTGDLQVMTIQPLRVGAKHRLTSSIKEKDYDLRELRIPREVETAGIFAGGTGVHELGEILFQTELGPFQIIPTRAADIEEIDSDCSP